MASEGPEMPRHMDGAKLTKGRFAIPADVRRYVSWISRSTPPIDCVASLGPSQQVTLWASDSPFAKRRSRFLNRFKAEPGLIESPDIRQLARFFATTWVLRIQASVYQLSLPQTLLEMWSEIPDTVTVISLGDVLEVWPSERWGEHVASISGSHEEIYARLFDETDESL